MTIKNIFTIGYGGRQFDDFINLLVEYRIDTILDIRSVPYSRFQHRYNKTNLEIQLPEQGIKYLYMGEALGGKPKAKIFYHTSGVLNHDLITITKSFQEAIDEVISIAAVNGNICILCSELKPDSCHRKTLVGQSLLKRGVVVNHIDEKGGLAKHTHNYPFPTLF